jgi:hypothetical protein
MEIGAKPPREAGAADAGTAATLRNTQPSGATHCNTDMNFSSLTCRPALLKPTKEADSDDDFS